ncbi:MAG TPA: NAD(P)-dependent oxidoreductase [Spirochaetia bacterium]|nr:NAD(P)-dependent oxidoreductase [Spirochaetia bacterium]
MARVLPVFLDVEGVRVLFVGGGKAAAQKLALLSEAAPALRLVAPRIDDEVASLVARFPGAEILRRPVAEADFEGVALVYGFTDVPEVNAQVAAWARARGLWSNVSNNRGAGSFTSPAVDRHGGLVLAVGSGDGPGPRNIAAAVSWRDRFAALWRT